MRTSGALPPTATFPIVTVLVFMLNPPSIRDFLKCKKGTV
jgi:hypothetical protein